ncbi:ROK family protein, partial [Azospirillum sp.]|uniref:ROK family protein n=1 Tax=Azospirillum sp. TaxID=34012 RepID=UPI002D416C5F
MRIGIDLGGTKIAAVALDDAGEERARKRVDTPRDYAGTLAALAGVVGALDGDGAASVGLSLPGVVDPAAGTVRAANLPWLNGRLLAGDLAAALGRPVRLANDANCFALSEAVDGAAAGAAVVFGVVLGTGVGGGLVVDGRILNGANA